MDVSVCIANWNCKDHLRVCLRSLCANHGVELEIIVVDNASTDGAADMVEHEFPQVILVRNRTNVGFARANNQAAALAHGRLLFFLNNDTIVPPDSLRKLADFLDRNPNVGLVGPRLRDGRGSLQVSHRPRPKMAHFLHKTYLLRWTGLFRRAYWTYRRRSFDPTSIQRVEVLMGAAMMIAKERFINTGGWDEQYTFGGEDIDLSLRVGQSAEVVYYPEVEITHFGRASTRANLSFAAPHIATGFLRYLRSQQYSRGSIGLYKLLITLDAPVQVFWKSLEYCWRRLWRRPQKAERSLSAIKAQSHFLLRGLVRFWKS